MARRSGHCVEWFHGKWPSTSFVFNGGHRWETESTSGSYESWFHAFATDWIGSCRVSKRFHSGMLSIVDNRRSIIYRQCKSSDLRPFLTRFSQWDILNHNPRRIVTRWVLNMNDIREFPLGAIFQNRKTWRLINHKVSRWMFVGSWSQKKKLGHGSIFWTSVQIYTELCWKCSKTTPTTRRKWPQFFVFKQRV